MNTPTVLIGDHSITAVRELAAAFTEAGYRVIGSLSDGLSLVATARERCPDVICLDIILPRLSGLQAIEALGPDCQSQFVVATAVSSRTRVAEAKRLGVSLYILKPTEHAKLVVAFRSLAPKLAMRSAV